MRVEIYQNTSTLKYSRWYPAKVTKLAKMDSTGSTTKKVHSDQTTYKNKFAF